MVKSFVGKWIVKLQIWKPIPELKSRQTEAKNVAIPHFEQQKGGI